MTATIKTQHPFKLKWWQAALLALPMLLLSAMMMLGPSGGGDTLQTATWLFTWALLNVFFFLMLLTGHTHRYRSILFVAVAVGFAIYFITNLIETRGSMILTETNVIEGETPFCHLVIPMILIPAALTQTIIFPGSLLEGFAPIAGMIVLWLGVSLALGRGWCSWGCFYGGFDEGFSCLAKKARIKHIDHKWTYLPYAVLLVIVLTSALTLSPTYCEWLCPFKAVTEFAEITSVKVLIQTIIFVTLFLGTVIVLPFLTKRRVQCGLFCPFGAMQSFLNKINIFELRIDTEKCSKCLKCVRSCPTFSLDENSLASGKPSITCTKCGQCIDACPKNAISYHIKGTPIGLHPNVARVLFIYPAFLLLVVIGGGMIAGGLWRILMLITTGSMI
ncbi:MAG: 4Fe-4S binding protein [Anaerolineae bacterium]|nr:4Fe-4S binding protein [Anaerolineae bacterium]